MIVKVVFKRRFKKPELKKWRECAIIKETMGLPWRGTGQMNDAGGEW